MAKKLSKKALEKLMSELLDKPEIKDRISKAFKDIVIKGYYEEENKAIAAKKQNNWLASNDAFLNKLMKPTLTEEERRKWNG